MKKYFQIFLCLFMLQTAQARAASNSTSQSSPDTKKTLTDDRFFRYRLNTMLGINISQGSGVLSGMQFGYAPFTSVPFYIGPEFTFVLYSPGSIFSLAAGGWYDFRVYGSPHLTLSVGAIAGTGFTSYLPQFPNSPFVGFLDISLSQELDDLASIRAQFRPGIIDKSIAYMMNISLSFRFQ